MVGCNRLGAACGVVAAVDVDVAGEGEGESCVYVLFGTMPADAGSVGAKVSQDEAITYLGYFY